jgi:hypothetical protein
MNSVRFSVVVLALGVALTACGEAPLGQGDVAPTLDQLDIVLGGGGTEPRSGSGGQGNALFDRIAGQLPHFAGMYRVEQCAAVIMLTGGNHEEAIRIVRAIVGPLVSESCPHGLQLGTAPAEFTYVELQRFLTAALPLLRMEGVYRIRVDYALNRLVVTVASREVADRAAHALAEAGVPEGAVIFRLRGGGGSTR